MHYNHTTQLMHLSTLKVSPTPQSCLKQKMLYVYIKLIQKVGDMPIIHYQMTIGCEHLNQNQRVRFLRERRSHLEKIRDGVIGSGREREIDIRELKYTQCQVCRRSSCGYRREVPQLASRALFLRNWITAWNRLVELIL